MHVLTGAADFIGSTVANRLLDRRDAVVGLYNLNDQQGDPAAIARCRAPKPSPLWAGQRVELVFNIRVAHAEASPANHLALRGAPALVTR